MFISSIYDIQCSEWQMNPQQVAKTGDGLAPHTARGPCRIRIRHAGSERFGGIFVPTVVGSNKAVN